MTARQMRKAVVVARESLPHHRSFGGALAAGLRRHGWLTEISNDAKPCDLLITWGVRHAARFAGLQRDAGGELLVLERGYLGDRLDYTSLSFGGGLNGHAEFRTPTGCPPERFASLGLPLAPWRQTDGPAVIMGQVPGDWSIRNHDFGAWVRRVAADARVDGFDVMFRQHPGARARGASCFGLPEMRGTLADCLAAAGLVITLNSNSGVDAVLAGVPTVATDAGSMVWGLVPRQVAVHTPDRSAWAARLAWCQYSKAELESGFAVEAVGLG